MRSPIIESYLDAFGAFEKTVSGNGKDWLRPARQAAISRFAERGFPTTGDEDWRSTDVSPMVDAASRPHRNGFSLTPGQLSAFLEPGLGGARMVFVNGHLIPLCTSQGKDSSGTKIKNLTRALQEDKDLVQQYLGRMDEEATDAFSWLNSAFLEDGTFLHIPQGTIFREPVHLVYLSQSEDKPGVAYIRNLVLLEKGAQAVVVQDLNFLEGGVQAVNEVTEVVLGENSHLTYYLLQGGTQRSYSVSRFDTRQGRDSTFELHTLQVGGALARMNFHPVLAGEGSSCLLNGLVLARDEEHIDDFFKVEHAGPHGTSRQSFNGILDGRAHGIFHGRIIVHPQAQRTDAKQTNRNLLLSDEAMVDSQPQLEIHADDVKCTHGATIGQIDEEAVFYLRTRGLGEKEARTLLLSAFAGERLQPMKLAPVRAHWERLVSRWLPRG
jgi:Fe-S cluster assembly protein SufD